MKCMISKRLYCLFTAVLSVILSVSASDLKPWALVTLSVANLRAEPAHKSELVSQATMGTPLRIIGSSGVWFEVESPDGYHSWVNNSSVVTLSEDKFDTWRESKRVVATNLFETHCYRTADCQEPHCIVSDIVNGDIMQLLSEEEDHGRLHVQLPDGRRGWIESTKVEDFDKWSRQSFDVEKIITMAKSMMGQPYLWGGTSTKGVDCSGLVRICYFYNGLLLRRDASQQARTGEKIDSISKLKPGDLIFFDNVGRGRVTHVGIYDKDGEYIHSSGRVGRNSLLENSPVYLPSKIMGLVRIAGMEGSDGITPIALHPWYFTNNEL